jgi:hypothetical protein
LCGYDQLEVVGEQGKALYCSLSLLLLPPPPPPLLLLLLQA